MANLITLSRLLLLVVVVVMSARPPAAFQLIGVPLLIVLFLTDALDGYVARRRDETSLFGAMFDIAGDRIVELTLWILFVHLDMVPIWVPMVFVARGVLVDTIRASQASSHRQAPFEGMRSPLGRWLVAGKFMRGFYAVLKAVTFCWLLLLYALPAAAPAIAGEWGAALRLAADAMVYLTVAICLLRGLPVIAEFVRSERAAILGGLLPRDKGSD